MKGADWSQSEGAEGGKQRRTTTEELKAGIIVAVTVLKVKKAEADLWSAWRVAEEL